MDAAELREMSDEQLDLTLKDACESLFRLRWQAQTERLDAPSELRRNRRLIARAKTVQRERELGGSLKVQARFVDQQTGRPVRGGEFRGKVVVGDQLLGEQELDCNGRAIIVCDLKEGERKEVAGKLVESRANLFVVLEKDGKEVFRSRGFSGAVGQHVRHGFNIGTMKV